MTSAESVAAPALSREAAPGGEWWRTAVIYQIYPRSFADQSGDGIGDLRGVTNHLGDLATLGIDAIWLSPFQRSPQKDAGYDVADYCDVDPIFGTLADFDEMLAQAHARGIRIIVDLVPNHSSDQHAWFQEAVASPAGSPERARYIFRDGKGANGELPPNNWESVCGGGAWTRLTQPDGTPGQWYLHLFDASQPDFDWSNPEVREEFRRILRFWLDRGVDGFRVDVAHGLVKKEGLPDYTPPTDAGSMGGGEAAVPYWGQDGVHEIYRDWHALLAEYDGDRALCAEAWLPSVAQTALWVRPDEMHQAFNFEYLETPWNAEKLRLVIADSLAGYGAVGAPSTWVLSNHDVVRHASRLALTAENPQGAGIGPKSPGKPIPEVGLRRARAATTLMLALPGSAYLYQGEELGLPEADVPYEQLKDPYGLNFFPDFAGRDGCRTPMPWEDGDRHAGFSTVDGWLPIPNDHLLRAVAAQAADPQSVLSFTRHFLRWRKARPELVAGDIDIVEATEHMICLVRSLNGRRLMVAIELAGRGGSVALAGEVDEVDEDHRLALGWVEGDRVTLPPYGAVFAWLRD